MFATAGSSDVGRSESIQLFHGSEVAFWPNAEAHVASVLMTTSLEKGNYILLESTSNGKDNLFYELCKDAIKKNNDFCFIFIPWFWHKEYAISELEGWEPSRAWLDYQLQYRLSLEQLRWAYLKNMILCKVSGENCDNGPSLYFKQEFPGSFEEAFASSTDTSSFISLREIDKNIISNEDLNNLQISESPKILKFKQQRQIHKNSDLILGVDVARGGGDYSWIIDRQGDFLGFNLNQKINLSDTMQVAYWVAEHIQNLKPYRIFIDAGGLGISVVDRLNELGYHNIVIGVNFASKASSNRFINVRAEMWYRMKEFFNKGGYIVEDPLLIKQICSVSCYYNLKGQIQLEAKKSIKNSLHMSPDGADAAALTFYHTNCPSNTVFLSELHTEYDPFAW